MKSKNASASLKEAILLLENKQSEELELLKDQLFVVYDKLKPINLIKNTFNEIASSLEIRSSLINRLLSALIGYLTHKAFVGFKSNLIKRLAGIFLEYGVSTVASKYGETIEAMGLQLISRLLTNKTDENIKPAAGNSENK
jgi:hypothetical protein